MVSSFTSERVAADLLAAGLHLRHDLGDACPSDKKMLTYPDLVHHRAQASASAAMSKPISGT